MKSILHLTRLFLVFISITLFSCNKESVATPEISFDVSGTKVICEGAEKVYGLYYLTQNKLSISASSNIAKSSGGEEIYDVKFIIQNVENLNALIDVEIPIQSSANNSANDMYVSGYIRPNTHPAEYIFTDIYFKITRLKHNKISGSFYGSLKSTANTSSMVVELGTLSDVSITTLQQ